jgi:putative membrane protein
MMIFGQFLPVSILPDRFLSNVVAALVFGAVGIFLLLLGYWLFDWITPKIDVQKELAENKNMAVAVVVAALLLGIAYIAAHVVQ